MKERCKAITEAHSMRLYEEKEKMIGKMHPTFLLTLGLTMALFMIAAGGKSPTARFEAMSSPPPSQDKEE